MKHLQTLRQKTWRCTMINTDLLPDAPKLTSLWVPMTNSSFSMPARKLSAITIVWNPGLFHISFCNPFFIRFNTYSILTLVSSWEWGFTILAEFFPSVWQQRGRAIQLPFWLVSAPKNLFVLHPNVLSQPLLSGCHIFTLVTLHFLGSTRIITGNPYITRSRFLTSHEGFSPSWEVVPPREKLSHLVRRRVDLTSHEGKIKLNQRLTRKP